MKEYQNVSDSVLSVLPVFALKFSVSFFFAGECNQRNLITVSNMGSAERAGATPSRLLPTSHPIHHHVSSSRCSLFGCWSSSWDQWRLHSCGLNVNRFKRSGIYIYQPVEPVSD